MLRVHPITEQSGNGQAENLASWHTPLSSPKPARSVGLRVLFHADDAFNIRRNQAGDRLRAQPGGATSYQNCANQAGCRIAQPGSFANEPGINNETRHQQAEQRANVCPLAHTHPDGKPGQDDPEPPPRRLVIGQGSK